MKYVDKYKYDNANVYSLNEIFKLVLDEEIPPGSLFRRVLHNGETPVGASPESLSSFSSFYIVVKDDFDDQIALVDLDGMCGFFSERDLANYGDLKLVHVTDATASIYINNKLKGTQI